MLRSARWNSRLADIDSHSPNAAGDREKFVSLSIVLSDELARSPWWELQSSHLGII